MYEKALSNIHNQYYSELSIAASNHIKSIFKCRDHLSVIDLGCGSGNFLRQLVPIFDNLYGMDISEHMIELAKINAPQAKLTTQTLFSAHLPNVDLVSMIGEVISYAAFNVADPQKRILQFFNQVFNCLNQQGVFLFDFLSTDHNFEYEGRTELNQYILNVNVKQHVNTIQRKITIIDKHSMNNKKTVETHHQILLDPALIKTLLVDVGFTVQQLSHYGDLKLLPGRIGFECHKL